ncbi:NmrA family NAD(P)-binding protein [Lutibaculum baratangense]|uniref:Miscellaneous n=1 Tax=Lutibaculum baratangense AMV1 TaxID=631454 RepID=V4RHC9_9HYPH|nr:NmrA family NAD(P)-binding protein [Lutibaculum baratangense]ESR22685.1 Miscellaneous [Lutibaculum baratangense AMV1]
MYVVLGANGRVGGETARALIASGNAVRLVLRRPEQAEKWAGTGAEIAIGSIEDGSGLVEALRGASGAFLLMPPPVEGDPFRRADELGSALSEAVRRAELPRVVALSSVGAQHETGTGIIATLNRLEKHLTGAAPSLTFLRPGYFVETWSEVVQAVLAEGVLPTFLEPSLKIPMVSTTDVGRTAAGLLGDGVTGARTVELRGPDDWSANDVAAAFGRALGRPVTASFIAPEARTAVLARAGVPPAIAEALLGMYDGIAGGRVEHAEGAERRRGSVALDDAVSRIVQSVEAEAREPAA